MEIQEVTDYLLLPNEFSLQQIVLHSLAKKYWGDFVLTDSIDGEQCCMQCKIKELIDHRKKVLNSLIQILKCLPNLLKKELVNAVLCIQRGYGEVLIWEEKCQSALPFTILNRMTAGDYHASNFIDPSGHFNDFVWAKRFVADEKQNMQCRFILACFYCFEETTVLLWHTMKNNMQLPCEGRLADIITNYGDLVGIWAYEVENIFDELMEENLSFENGFHLCGLVVATVRGHAYAVCYFWKHCSDNEKARFLLELQTGYDSLIFPAEDNHADVVNFIYSLLSKKQKANFFSLTIQKNMSTIWSCLLHSKYYETVLNDIFDSSFAISVNMYGNILSSLSCKMTELPIPIYETIFIDIWNHLSQETRIEVLQIEDSCLILQLANIKAMDLLKMIIQPLSHFQKEMILLNNWQYGGIHALTKFYSEKDYDALRRYLLFFFMDCCPITQKLSLRSDASTFLDKFVKSANFINLINSLHDSEEFKIIIENLQDSLKVLYLLLEKVGHSSN